MDTETGECILNWRNDIVVEARTWLNTPYHHKGRVKGVGVDCGGLIYEVYKKVLGIPPEPFPDNYAEDWGLHKEDNELYLNFIMPYVQQTSKLMPGDLVVFQFGRAFAHGTIYIGNDEVIHAYGRTGFGVVMKSQIRVFQIGKEVRASKAYTLGDQWLPAY